MFFVIIVFQRSGPQPLWDASSLQYQENDLQVNGPEYSYMENTYNQSTLSAKNFHNQSGMFNTHVNHGNHLGQHHDNQSVTEHSSKHRNHSGIHTVEFDGSAVKQKSPPKERPAFGHRPLSGKQKKQKDEFIIGKGIRPDSAKVKKENQGKSRPSSGRQYMVPVNVNSISAYLQLKREGKLNLPHATGARSAAGM